MKPSLKIIALSLLVLCASLIEIAPSNAAISYFNSCGTKALVRPTSVLEYCGDAGAGVTNIKWSTWNAATAKGRGIFYINSCTPNCAAGKIYKTNANVLLSDLIATHGKNYLMKVTVTPLSGKTFFWPLRMKPAPAKITWTTDTWQG